VTAPTVEKAAILHAGVVYSVPRPGRHHDVIQAIIAAGKHGSFLNQGFVLSNGSYVNRAEAAAIAIASGQITVLRWPSLLYSEDLW